MRTIAATFFVALIVLPIHTSNAQTASFTGLGQPPSGYTQTVNGVSADGKRVCGGYVAGTGRSFLWQEGGAEVDLTSGAAWSISADGQIVVGGFNNPATGKSQGYRWTAKTGPIALPLLPGNDSGYALGTSSDGGISVGTCYNASSSAYGQAAAWNADGVALSLGGIAGQNVTDSVAYASSANGQIIVGTAQTLSGQFGFQWTVETGMIALSDLPGGYSDGGAFAVSGDGSVIVGFGTNQNQDSLAVMWSDGSQVSLGTLPGSNANGSKAYGISDDGLIVVGYSLTSTFTNGAFIWDRNHGMRAIHDLLVNNFGITAATDWNLIEADAISSDGRTIVGWGLNPQAYPEAWRAVIPRADLPCPGDANGDRSIDIADLALLLSEFGQTGPNLPGDFNHDNQIDLSDLATLLANFGATCP